MCGITGIFDSSGHRPVAETLLRTMNNSQQHRGPDGDGLWIAPGIGFGHRRLAIIDLAGGYQPMHTQDGRISVVFNGEIYNFQETRALLEDCGYSFRTHSDTEVILYAWAEWGEACLHHFRGMFTIALYDSRTETLFLARDRLGVKPLHYAILPDGQVLFGSELKSLMAHPGIGREIDLAAIEDYFALGYVPDSRCILRGVRKLPAGHSLTIRRNQPIPQPKAYWSPDFHTRHSGTDEDLAAELMARVREAVELRMIADVPLGAFLSGGVDSSAVVAAMAELSSTPVNTCSIGFDHESLDETAYAQRVANRYGTRHSTRTVAADDFHLIDRLASAYDEPFADASALPMYRVCELARETVTVALSGDGADEVLAGYRRYRLFLGEEQVRGMVPGWVRRGLFGWLGQVYPKLDWAPRPLRGKATFQALAMSTADAYFNAVAVVRDGMREKLFSPSFRSALQGYRANELYREAMAAAPTDDALARAQYADIKIWLPGDILTKVDRASMAVSLEAREPLLDHKLIEWAAGLAPRHKIRDGQGKWLFKQALRDKLPEDILYRPKMGFVVPIAQWFRGPLAGALQQLGQKSLALSTGWFDTGFVRTCIDEHQRGLRDHSRMLWQLFMLDRALAHLLGETQSHLTTGGQ